MKDFSLKKDWPEALMLLVVFVLSPVFLFPRPEFLWGLVLIPVLFLVLALKKRPLVPRTLLDWPVLLLLVQVFATCLFVPDLPFSLPKITGVLFGILFLYSLTALLKSAGVVKLAVITYAASGVVFSLIGLFGLRWDYDSLIFALARVLGFRLDRYIFYRDVIPALDRVIPRIKWHLPGAEQGFNGNAVGGILILVVPLCLTLGLPYLRIKDKAGRIVPGRFFPVLLLVFLFILTAVLFLTLSIAAWVGLAAGIWIVLFSKKGKIWSAGLTVAALVFLVILFPARVSRLSDSLHTDLDPEKIDYRIHWWSVALETIRDRPLFGVGLNRMRLNPEIGYEKAHVHNQFLQTAAELGIPGLIAFLGLVGTGLFMAVKVWTRPGAPWMRPVALGLACGLAAHLVFGLVDAIPLGTKVGIFFWFWLALSTSMYRVSFKEREVRS